jgi:hypothetical protein
MVFFGIQPDFINDVSCNFLFWSASHIVHLIFVGTINILRKNGFVNICGHKNYFKNARMQSKHPAFFASLEKENRRERISNRATCGCEIEQSRLWVVHRIKLWLLTQKGSPSVKDGLPFWYSPVGGDSKRRLLATCLWHAATAVDPSRSEGESPLEHQNRSGEGAVPRGTLAEKLFSLRFPSFVSTSIHTAGCSCP